MAAALGAHGEHAGGRERVIHGLGQVEVGVGVLTLKGIEPTWSGRGNRRGGSVLGKNRARKKLARGGR